MKTLSKFFILLCVSLIAFYACEEDTFTEEDAITAIEKYEEQNDSTDFIEYLTIDSINNKDVVLTIKVVNATGDFATKGATGATVTINIDGETLSEITGTDGAAHFTGLQEGSYAVNVMMTGYTTVDFVTNINSYGYYSVQVPILSTTTGLMTIQGTVTYEDNLLNTSRENAANVTVIAKPDLPNYFGSIPGISEIAYSGYTNSTTTITNGQYSIDVPADKAGDLEYDIFVPIFEANQSLMLNELNGVDITGAGNAVQAIATRFGTELSGSESAVPAVNPIYCMFSAPTHPFIPATLTVEIDDDNTGVIDKAYVSVAGANYGPNDPTIVITNANPDGSDASITLVTDDNTGQIEYMTVTGGGSDFTAIPTLDLGFEQDDADIEVASIDGSGAITGITIVNGGEYLTNDLTLIGGTGTGAELGISWSGSYYYINTTINEAGTGYTVGNKLSVSVPTTAASGYVTMGTPIVSSVQVTNQGSGYEVNATYPVIFSYGDATATASTDAYGRVYKVEVTAGSYNYTIAPTASVDYKFFPETATASVFVQDGEVKSIFNLDGGAGYDVLPTLTFYSQYDAGNPAVTIDYDVTINGSDPYDVTAVTINQGGADIKENLATKQGDAAQNNVKSIPGVTIYADFYLGTGVRTAGN